MTHTKYQKGLARRSMAKGSAQTGTIALIILVIFLFIGGTVYYIYRETPARTTGYDTNTTTGNPIITSTRGTLYEPGTTQTIVTQVNPFPGGPVYKNPNYGLTISMPSTYAGYTVLNAREAFAGVYDLDSLHFYNGGVNTFTINVFTKQQWNDIRIQETNNQVNGYGEGTYLGENKNYIFSTNTTNPGQVQQIFDNILFY